MIELTKYQLAENEIRLLFFKYNDSTVDELKDSNLVSDVDAYLKKWSSKISAIRILKKELSKEITQIKCNQTTDLEDIILIYIKYLNGLYLQMVTINVLIMNKRIVRISSQIVKGIESYYYNHYY